MKKILIILVILVFMLSSASCDENGTVTMSNQLIKIEDFLYYDSTTRIVYWWNGNICSNFAIAPSPYYAPNGLPYRYNPETNTFETIGLLD